MPPAFVTLATERPFMEKSWASILSSELETANKLRNYYLSSSEKQRKKVLFAEKMSATGGRNFITPRLMRYTSNTVAERISTFTIVEIIEFAVRLPRILRLMYVNCN